MKKLVKIKLINWHLFSNHTINIEDNVLISGENGSGKSTLLDAVQYVLTAGRPKFNNAANDTNNRDLVGYIRGKIGVEGKIYLRNNDVTSHIALEYQDGNIKQVIGVVLSLSESNYKREHFYQIVNSGISEDLYINENIINDYAALKKTCNLKNITFNSRDTKVEAKNLIRTALGVEKKYFDLIPKALAFKPINDLHKFIFDFLLVEDIIQIENLRNNIRKYRELDNILKEQERRIILLQDIENNYFKYEEIDQNILIAKIMIDIHKFSKIETELKKCRTKYKNNTTKIHENNTQINKDEIEIEVLKQEVFHIQSELSSNKSYVLLRDIESRIKNLKIEEKDLDLRYNVFITLIENEQNLLDVLNIKIDIRKYQSDDYLNIVETATNKLNSKREEIFLKREKSLQKVSELNTDLEINLKTLDKLRKNKFSYSLQVTELIKIVKEKLYQKFNKDIEVMPLCELIDIKDELWRNACEGYLNSQRFDLIIEEQYFEDASKIYEEFKKENNLFGVGIVDVSKLKTTDVAKTSLSDKIVCHTSAAKNYINMLLKNVNCVEDIKDIKLHNCAITKSCMVYKNHTIRAINPKVYSKPFIGKAAILIQIQSIEETIKISKEHLKKALKDSKNYQLVHEGIMQSRLHEVKATCSVVNMCDNIKLKITELQDKLKSLQKDSSLLNLESQLIKSQENQKQVEKNREKVVINNSLLSQENENLIEKTSDLSISLEEYEQKVTQHENSNVEVFKTAQTRLEKKVTIDSLYEMLEAHKMSSSRLKDLIIHKMQNFNIETNIGYTQNIESISQYLNHLFKIRDLEILKSREDLKATKLKCEQTFQEDFISRLREKINNAIQNIKLLNNSLKDKHFNDDTYQFVISKSKKENFKDYYEIIMSDQEYEPNGLFLNKLNDKNKIIMDELFEKLTIIDDDSKNEKIISEYIDYRNYLNYDIKIKHKNGDTTYFSKVSREKSGGETQTPFYVIIASSFEQLIKKQRNTQMGCLVLFDEAFNNMDETRIEAMMEFYNRLQIQVILSVPPGRIATIQPYVTTSLMITKDNNYSYVGEFING